MQSLLRRIPVSRDSHRSYIIAILRAPSPNSTWKVLYIEFHYHGNSDTLSLEVETFSKIPIPKQNRLTSNTPEIFKSVSLFFLQFQSKKKHIMRCEDVLSMEDAKCQIIGTEWQFRAKCKIIATVVIFFVWLTWLRTNPRRCGQ